MERDDDGEWTAERTNVAMPRLVVAPGTPLRQCKLFVCGRFACLIVRCVNLLVCYLLVSFVVVLLHGTAWHDATRHVTVTVC